MGVCAIPVCIELSQEEIRMDFLICSISFNLQVGRKEIIDDLSVLMDMPGGAGISLMSDICEANYAYA